MRFAAPAFALLSTLWVGALWAIGYLAVPLLFANLSDHALAGRLAGGMFSAVGLLGIACAAGMLAILLAVFASAAPGRAAFWIVAAMLLIASVIQFGIQPAMQQLKESGTTGGPLAAMLPSGFASLHGLSSALYLAQSAFGAILVVAQRRLFA